MGNGYITTLPLVVFTQRNFVSVADFIRLKLNLIKNKKNVLSHLLGDLKVMYALHL